MDDNITETDEEFLVQLIPNPAFSPPNVIFAIVETTVTIIDDDRGN